MLLRESQFLKSMKPLFYLVKLLVFLFLVFVVTIDNIQLAAYNNNAYDVIGKFKILL